jgi:hypothetical protein
MLEGFAVTETGTEQHPERRGGRLWRVGCRDLVGGLISHGVGVNNTRAVRRSTRTVAGKSRTFGLRLYPGTFATRPGLSLVAAPALSLRADELNTGAERELREMLEGGPSSTL